MDKNLKNFVEIVQSVLTTGQRKEIMFKANIAQRTMYTYFKKLAAADKPEPEDNRLKSILCISDNSPTFYKELRSQV
jgi:predicted transcriptional regulator